MPARKQKGRGVGDVLRYIRDNKLISGGLRLIPNPYAQAGSTVASLIGLGKRKAPKRRRRMAGKGIFNDIGSGLGNLAYGVGGGLGSLGHGLFGGKKRKKRTMRGGSMILNGTLL